MKGYGLNYLTNEYIENESCNVLRKEKQQKNFIICMCFVVLEVVDNDRFRDRNCGEQNRVGR